MKNILCLCVVLSSFGCAMESVDGERSAESNNPGPNDPPSWEPQPQSAEKHEDQNQNNLPHPCDEAKMLFAGSCSVTVGDTYLCVDLYSNVGFALKPECPPGSFANVPCQKYVAGIPVLTCKEISIEERSNVCYKLEMHRYLPTSVYEAQTWCIANGGKVSG